MEHKIESHKKGSVMFMYITGPFCKYNLFMPLRDKKDENAFIVTNKVLKFHNGLE